MRYKGTITKIENGQEITLRLDFEASTERILEASEIITRHLMEQYPGADFRDLYLNKVKEI